MSYNNITLLANPKYYLAVVAIFRNEVRFLKEWIEFHKLVGVEHFYLYNNLSTDDYMSVLSPYIDSGLVELFNITTEHETNSQWYFIQNNVYLNTAKSVASQVEWLAAIDIDEFLFSPKNINLNIILKDYDNYASISVNWRMFGSSNVTRIRDDQLMTEVLLFSEHRQNLHVKSFFKPRYVVNIENPHYAVLEKGHLQITENYQEFIGPFSPFHSSNILRINHYWCKDLEFFNSTKLSRTHIKEELKDNESLEKANYLSLLYDDSISPITKTLKKNMFPSMDYELPKAWSVSLVEKWHNYKGLFSGKEHIDCLIIGIKSIELAYISANYCNGVSSNVVSLSRYNQGIVFEKKYNFIYVTEYNINIADIWQSLESKGLMIIDKTDETILDSLKNYQITHKETQLHLINTALDLNKDVPLLSVDIKAYKQNIDALLYSVLKQSIGGVKNILQNGNIDPNEISPMNCTYLYLSVELNNLEMSKLFLEYGANTEIKSVGNGATALYMAVQNDNFEMTKTLLEYGANVNNGFDRFSPLCIAYNHANIEIIKLLLAYNADIKLHAICKNNEIEEKEYIEIDELFVGTLPQFIS
jgi:hypothetical protein